VPNDPRTKQTLGKRLAALRGRRTRKDVATACNGAFHENTLRDWENDRATPALDKAAALADFFGLTLDELCGRLPKMGTRHMIDQEVVDRILNTKDQDELLAMIEPPEIIPIGSEFPSGYRLVADAEAMRIGVQVGQHLSRHAPEVVAAWGNAWAQFLRVVRKDLSE